MSFSYEHHFYIDRFCHSLTYAIHPLHPLHFVGCFELFGNAFPFGIFFSLPEKEFLWLLFGVGNVGMELAGSEQIIVQDFMTLFQVPKPALHPYADGAFFGRKCNIGQPIIAMRCVSTAACSNIDFARRLLFIPLINLKEVFQLI